MTTLTETIIDFADSHTTLYYLGASPPQTAPLPFGTAEGYYGLYQTIAAPVPISFNSVTQGHPATLLLKLSLAYRKNKYWKLYLSSGQHDIYHERVWESIIPIETSLIPRIEFITDSRFKFKVSPLPRVMLYPFGWSSWLSLRLTEPHTLQDLSALFKYVFAEKAFRINPDPTVPNSQTSTYSLRDVFDYMAQGVRTDAFGGNKTKDFDSQEITAVTTILRKYGGSLSLGALNDTIKEQILRIVKPEGPYPKAQFSDYIFKRAPDELLEYIVMNDCKRFVWLEHLLRPQESNYALLRCYHNNTFHSLVHARQLLDLLVISGKQKTLSKPLSELVENTINILENPNYMNASLKKFLQTYDVVGSIERIKKSSQGEKDN